MPPGLRANGGSRGARRKVVYRIETGMFSKPRKLWAPMGPSLATDIETVYTRLSSQRDDLAKLSRYENSIERSLRRALLDLERRQARRKAGDSARRLVTNDDGAASDHWADARERHGLRLKGYDRDAERAPRRRLRAPCRGPQC